MGIRRAAPHPEVNKIKKSYAKGDKEYFENVVMSYELRRIGQKICRLRKRNAKVDKVNITNTSVER